MAERHLKSVKHGGQNAASVDEGAAGGDDGGMDERLRKLEQSVGIIQAKLPELATNESVDARLSKSELKIILWVGGVVVATGLASKFIGGTAPPSPAAPSAPIIIQMPSQQQPAPAPTPPPKAP